MRLTVNITPHVASHLVRLLMCLTSVMYDLHSKINFIYSFDVSCYSMALSALHIFMLESIATSYASSSSMNIGIAAQVDEELRSDR